MNKRLILSWVLAIVFSMSVFVQGCAKTDCTLLAVAGGSEGCEAGK